MSALAGTQLGLFGAAKARKERGQRLAIEGADAEYRELLWVAIEYFARSGVNFTADDVLERVGPPPAGFSSNVRGAIFSAAAKRGLIRMVGFGISGQTLGRGNLLRVWRGTRA